MSNHLSLARMLLEEFSFIHSSELAAVDHKDGRFPFESINNLAGFIKKLVSQENSSAEAQYSILFRMLTGATQEKLKRSSNWLSFMRPDAWKNEVHDALVGELKHILENRNTETGITNSVGFFQDELWRCDSATKSHYIKQLITWHDDGNMATSQSRYIRRLALATLFSPFLSWPFDVAKCPSLEEVVRKLESLPQGRSALCLSGGGIRSATFALGLIQSLTRLRLLHRFDYLSTVSGGGYTGSWLSAWIKREGPDQVLRSLSQDPCDRKQNEHSLESDPKEIAYIRRLRNYLIPNWGLFSPDTWTLAATYLRNLFLNWLTLIPALVCVLALVRIDVLLIVTDDVPLIGLCGGFWAGTLLTIWSIGFLSWHLRSARIETVVSQQRPSALCDQDMDGLRQTSFNKRFLWGGLAPLICAGFILTLFWAKARMDGGTDITCGTEFLQSWWNGSWLNSMIPWKLPMPFEVHPANFSIFAIIVHLAGVLVRIGLNFFVGRTKTPESDKQKKEKRRPLDFAGWLALILTLLIASLSSGLATYLAATNLFLNPKDTPFAYAVFATPLLLTIFLLGLDIFVGLRSRWNTDAEREQKARLNGFVLKACLLWVVVSSLVLYGPLWITRAVLI